MPLLRPMRFVLVAAIVTAAAFAQFKSTAPLVLAPTTVTDARGNYVDGLSIGDLILYDNNVPQPIQMDQMLFPISLVVAVQTSENAGAIIDKLGGSGVLFSQLLAADAGQTAMISFSDDVRLHQDFTGDPDKLTHSLRMLRKEGGGAITLDALGAALTLLEKQPPGRRRIVLMIAERRDRSSQAKLAEIMQRVQRTNATVYWLTWSPFLTPFTVKPRTMEDLKPEAERDKLHPDDRGAPLDAGPGGLTYAAAELFHLNAPDISELFTKTTGGRSIGFVRKNALEDAIHLVSEEVHRQYLISFQPKTDKPGTRHTVRGAVKNRPDLHVRTREGYWALP